MAENEGKKAPAKRTRKKSTLAKAAPAPKDAPAPDTEETAKEILDADAVAKAEAQDAARKAEEAAKQEQAQEPEKKMAAAKQAKEDAARKKAILSQIDEAQKQADAAIAEAEKARVKYTHRVWLKEPFHSTMYVAGGIILSVKPKVCDRAEFQEIMRHADDKNTSLARANVGFENIADALGN